MTTQAIFVFAVMTALSSPALAYSPLPDLSGLVGTDNDNPHYRVVKTESFDESERRRSRRNAAHPCRQQGKGKADPVCRERSRIGG